MKLLQFNSQDLIGTWKSFFQDFKSHCVIAGHAVNKWIGVSFSSPHFRQMGDSVSLSLSTVLVHKTVFDYLSSKFVSHFAALDYMVSTKSRSGDRHCRMIRRSVPLGIQSLVLMCWLTLSITQHLEFKNVVWVLIIAD